MISFDKFYRKHSMAKLSKYVYFYLFNFVANSIQIV